MTPWIVALVVAVVVVSIVTLRTASRPPRPPGALDAYLDGWSELHGAYDPRASSLTRGWLAVMHRLAYPLARAGVQPNALTLWGLVASLLVVVCAVAGGGWLLVGVVVVVLSGVADGLDGAVAVLTGRATRWGYVLDSVVDRCSDALYVGALLVLGAPPSVAYAAVTLVMLQEYVRARAAAVGMSEVGVVTVWERPTRVIVTAVALSGAWAAGLGGWSVADAAAVGAWASVVLGLIGTGQVLRVVRASLT